MSNGTYQCNICGAIGDDEVRSCDCDEDQMSKGDEKEISVEDMKLFKSLGKGEMIPYIQPSEIAAKSKLYCDWLKDHPKNLSFYKVMREAYTMGYKQAIKDLREKVANERSSEKV